MRKFTLGLALLALLGSGLTATDANADGKIVVYFDPLGTKRGGFSPGAGQLSTLFIYGEGFGDVFITGAQYAIDYGPDLTFFVDVALPAVSIGTSATGISMGFGQFPKPGGKFLMHLALVYWNSDCSLSQNNLVVTGPHPLFPDATPILTTFPAQNIITGSGEQSQSCQMVEMDARPLHCPNPFSAKVWEYIGSEKPWKGGWLAVAILGSSTVDVNAIDKTSLLLEGVAPIPWPQTTWFDVGYADGDNDCHCDFPATTDSGSEDFGDLIGLQRDGEKDLLIFFRMQELAAAISMEPPHTGEELTLTLTGAYDNGMPFESSDCVTIVEGTAGRPTVGHDQDTGSDDDAASLGFPSPNPFNPVTRINYSIPATQHVRIAVYDVAGRLVDDLVNEVKGAGEYVIEWDAGRLPSGVYFYRMQAGDRTMVRRATLLK
jgi:hypothetical protein